MQSDMQKYVDELETMGVPTEPIPFQPKTVFRSLMAQVIWPVGQVLPQLAYAVGKTAKKPEDGWTVADVKDLNKLVRKGKSV